MFIRVKKGKMTKLRMKTRRKKIAFKVTLFIALSIILSQVAYIYAVTIDPDLEDSQTTGNGHFIIHYTDCNPTNHPGKCVTVNDINDLDDQLEDIYDIYTDSTGDFRFNDPTRGNVFPVQVLPTDAGGMAYCTGTDCGISLAPAIFNNPLSLECLPIHELLHQVQWTYGWDWSGFVLEGTARMIQDKIYNDLDQSWGTELCAYFPEANDFLLSFTDDTLIDLSYRACLFWTYLTEQYGTSATEPQVGVDAIRALFDNYGGGSDDIQRVNAALSVLSPDTTFRDVFMDFIIANYAKDLTGPNVPDEYQYIDDNRQPGAYARPFLTASEDMDLGDTENGNTDIRSWSARYYEVRPSTDVPIVNLEFTQTGAPTTNLVYNLLVIDDDDLVIDLCEFNLVRKDYVRSIINRGYDRFVVVVGAFETAASYDYSLNADGGLSNLDIKWPITSNPAIVDVDDLNTFLIHLEVVGPTGSSLHGLEIDDFQVAVDGSNFDIITGVDVMNQYWLAMQPVNLGVGQFDLQVELAIDSISDTEIDAVEFRDEINADNVIVIDRSGSMLEPDWTGPFWEPPHPYDKIYGAMDAATLYVNCFRTDDKIGLVWFSNDAETAMSLSDFTEANRVDMIDIIDTFDQNYATAWRATSIGDGLWNAQEELNTRGEADHSWVIILLSDGLENQDRRISDVVQDGGQIDYVSSTGDPDTTKTVIHTVALGSNADREKLEDLADLSGGRFEYVVEPASGDLPNDLADVYRLFVEEVLQEERILAVRGSYHYDMPAPTHIIEMESGTTEATFVVNYNWKSAKYGGVPEVLLIDPTGNQKTPMYVDDTHHLFRVPYPPGGSWNVKIEQPINGTSVEGQYLVEVSVKSVVNFDAFIANSPEERKMGIEVPILAFLTDTKPITGVNVTVELTPPEITNQTVIIPSETDVIMLYDDGNHGDGKADDGVYAGVYHNTNLKGIYDVKIVAEGTSPIVGRFRRETRLAFNIRDDPDSDEDGLPDTWEQTSGLDHKDPKGDNGPEGDPDNDGLTNIEEFEHGTKPLDPDTDDGGENDGSEVSGRQNPNDPDDDVVSPLTSIRAIPGIGYVTLVLGYLPDHDFLVLSRTTELEGPWQSFEINATNEYVDEGLENDVTYYYSVVGVKEEDVTHVSTPTRIVSATPKTDPVPPSGYVEINQGDVLTDVEEVTLTMWADPDTTEMKITNDPDFTNAVWEPFDTTKIWNLHPGTGLRTVYVLFKDGVGNIGPRSSYDPSVEIQPATDTIILKEIEGVPASFLVDILTVNPSSVKTGESVAIAVNIMNTGGTVGTHTIQLNIDAVFREEAVVTLAPNDRKTYVFEISTIEAGVHSVEIEGLIDSYEVEALSIWERFPWLPYVLIVLALVVAAFILWLIRRK